MKPPGGSNQPRSYGSRGQQASQSKKAVSPRRPGGGGLMRFDAKSAPPKASSSQVRRPPARPPARPPQRKPQQHTSSSSRPNQRAGGLFAAGGRPSTSSSSYKVRPAARPSGSGRHLGTRKQGNLPTPPPPPGGRRVSGSAGAGAGKSGGSGNRRRWNEGMIHRSGQTRVSKGRGR